MGDGYAHQRGQFMDEQYSLRLILFGSQIQNQNPEPPNKLILPNLELPSSNSDIQTRIMPLPAGVSVEENKLSTNGQFFFLF